jgi:hypothetical protein
VGRVAGNASRGGVSVSPPIYSLLVLKYLTFAGARISKFMPRGGVSVSPPIYSLLVLEYLTLCTKIAFVVEVWELMCREMMEDTTLLRLKVLSLPASLVQKVQILTRASEARVCAWIHAGRNVEHRAVSYALVLDYAVYLLLLVQNYEYLLYALVLHSLALLVQKCEN